MKIFFISALLLVGQFALAQGYEGHPCAKGSPLLKNLLQKKEIKSLVYINGCDPDRGLMASSFLKASGRAPMRVKDPNFKPPPNWEEADGDYDYDHWTCMYAGGSAVDENKATAWVEGVAGNGAGEALMITQLDLSRKVEILSGFAKSPALFAANNRPKTINVHVVRAHPKPGGASQCGENYDAMKLIATKKITLRNVMEYQPLPLPVFKTEKYSYQNEAWDYSYWLMIEIIDVYPGSKYQDTCISEIRNGK
jgi:hypothetical protein